MRGSIKSSRLWKRLLSGAMTAAMMAGLLPGLPGFTMTAHAAENEQDTKDAYGFTLEVPDSFKADDGVNPYGSAAVTGHVNFNPVKELGIYESAAQYQKNVALNMDRKNKFSTIVPTNGGNNHYYRNTSQLVGALAGSGNHQFFSTGYASKLQYVRGVAYDPTGSGKDDHVVYYGFGNNRNTVSAGTWQPGFIAFEAKEKGNKGNNTIYSKGNSNQYSYMEHISPHEADGYNALVAGDFNGDSKDTIVVYDPAQGALQLKEYGNVKNNNVAAINIGSDQTIAKYFNKNTLNTIQTANGNIGSIHRNTAMVHLAAGDLDGDEADELVVTISLNDLDGGKEGAIGGNSYGQGGSTASVVAVYDKKGSKWEMAYSAQLANVFDTQHRNTKSYQGWFLRSAASAIGDIDGDDAQEIVTVGTPADDLRHNDDDLWKTDVMVFTVIDCDNGKYSLRTVENAAREQYKDAAGPERVPEGWYITNNGGGNFGDWAPTHSPYADNAPLSIGCVQLEGTGTTPYVFAQGHIFQFADDKKGKMQFAPAKNLGDTGSSQNLDRYLEGMHYVSQPVIANFDGNLAGRQQVFFVVGNNGTDHWIIGLTFDPSNNKKVMDGTGLYSSDWNTNVIGKNSAYSTFVALTAPDIDTDDGMLAHYTGKQYTWADPEIMAVLEASPYFEALVDEYPETSGSTSFGTGKATGSGKTETSSTKAGAYVSFSQDIGAFGFKGASVEMEASFESEWSSEVAKSTEYEYTMDFETGRDYNQVLLLRTPVIVYNYDVWDTKGNKSEMNISTAQQPLYSMIPVEKYNAMARSLKKTEIGSDIVSAVPGQPNTYRKNANGLNNAQTLGGNWIDTGGGGNNVVTQSITKSTTTDITTSLTHSFDVKAGAGAGGFVVGASLGGSTGKAQTVTDTTSVTRAGAVASVPAAYSDAYGFQWQFMTWDAKIDGYTVPVLSYLVKGVRQAPSLPQNVNAVAETNSITLTWEAGFSSAEQYEIWRYLDSTKNYYKEATVMGNAADEDGNYTYEITGLKPGMPYSYSLRSVGDGKYSAYTEPLTVVTASQGGDLPSILLQPKDEHVRPDGTAQFEVAAKSSGGGSLSFQWQKRKAGKIAWENEGRDNSGTLTIPNVPVELNGYQYRCKVSQVSKISDTEVFIYSNPVTLTVGKARSETTVLVNGAGKSGGTADYMVDVAGEPKDITKIYEVKIGEDTHRYYAYGTNDPYYYCLDDGKYYRLAGLTEEAADASGVVTTTANSRTELESLSGALVQTVGDTMTLIARTNELRSTVQDTKTFDDVVYNVFTAQGVAVQERAGDTADTLYYKSTLTLYQKKENSDTKFYVAFEETPEDAAKPVTKLEEVKPASADTEKLKNMTYSGTPESVWSDTQYETEGEGENKYTVLTNGKTNIYQKATTYYTRTEGDGATHAYTPLNLLSTKVTGSNDATVTTTPLGTVGKDGAISDRIDHSSNSKAETVKVTTTKQELAKGGSVTLTANVTKGTGKVVFQIVNTTTGSEQKVEATLSKQTATAAWRPTAAGVYQITATYQGDGDTLPSTSQPATYYAYVSPDTTSGYRLKLAESLTYGDAITPSLMKWTGNENGQITETPDNTGGVTYTAHAYLGEGKDGADADGYSKIAVDGWEGGSTLTPGNYLIRAAWGDDKTASVKLTVNKRPVTVAAPALGILSEESMNGFNLADYLKDIKVVEGTILDADKATYGGAAEGYPNLFCLTDGPLKSAGSYDVNVGYAANGESANKAQKDAYTDFVSKYLPTLQKSVVYVQANVVKVSYKAGVNGTLSAQHQGETVHSEETVPTGSQLIFTAEPETGFFVSHWTINGETVKNGTSDVTLLNGGKDLIVKNITRDITVCVEFSNEIHTVTFSSSGNGTVTAATAGGPLSSGTTVVGGSTVTFTAQPAPNFVVESWIVNGKVQKNEDGSNYVGSTRTLENISENTTVAVAFAKAEYFKVTFTAVNSEDKTVLTTGVELKTEGLDGNKQALKGSTVTLTATPNTGNAILAWQVEKDGTWENLTGSKQSYTIPNLQSDMNIRVLVNNKATTYSVNFDIYAEDNLKTPAANAGTLSAAITGATIESGNQQPNGSKVVFTYEAPSDYEFVKWVVNDKDAGTAGPSYTVNSLMAHTTVKAVVRKKPQVTISNEMANGGTVEVTGTVNGQSVTLADGAYVDFGSALTVLLKPDHGYEVDKSITADYTGESTDDKTYTITNVTKDRTITAAWSELPTRNVTFSVVDTNGATEGGKNGSLTASVDRKGMEDYKEDNFTSGNEVYEGSTVTFTAAADRGYRVKEWKVGDKVYTEGSSPFLGNILTLPYEELTGEVTVQFEQGHARIAFTQPAHGTLTAKSANTDFTSGGTSIKDIVFTVVPNENYEVKAWTVNGKAVENETGNQFTYKPTDNVTIAVELQGVVLEVTAKGGEGGTVSGLPEEVRYGEKVTLIATPSAGYVFEGWYLNDARIAGAGAKYTFTAAEGASYEARFTPTADNTVTFSVNDGTRGAITATANGTSITSGDSLTGGQKIVFTVTPKEGHRVKEWNGLPDGAQISADKTIATVPALSGSLNVAAVLEVIPQRTITLSPLTGRGTITAQVNGKDVTQVPDGTVVTFTASPAPGWTLGQWTGDVAGKTEQSFTMKITKDVTIGAVFKGAVHYTVKYNVDGANGSVSAKANGSTDVASNTEVGLVANSRIVFTAVPENSYMVKKWKINGAVQDTLSNTLTIDALTENIDVTVEFEMYTAFGIPTSNTGYTIDDVVCKPADIYAGAPTNEIRRGGDLTFKVNPASGYTTISKLVINGYDCIAGSGTATNCEKVNAVKNDDGSYTVTIQGVTGKITTAIKAHQIKVGELTVPKEFKDNSELNTVAKIQSKLKTAVTGSKDGIVYHDVALKYVDNNGDWIEVDNKNFPKNGVDVVLPYPADTGIKDTFTVIHMLTTGKNAGKTEQVTYEKKVDGLHFHVTSLSPFAIGWTRYTAPVGPSGGGGGGGVMPAETVTVLKCENGTVTADAPYAAKGDTVTLTVKPNNGYRLDTLTVTTEKGDTVQVTDKGNGVYTFTMPNDKVSVDVTFVAEKQWTNPFVDVTEDTWYYDAVKYVNENGLMAGTGANTFAPDLTTTRGMIVTILYRLEGSPNIEDEIWGYPFRDVDANGWYATAVYWARMNGIVAGYSDELFGPDDTITREQMATILYRYAQYKSYDTTAKANLSKYTDDAQVGSWALESIRWANAEGLVNGTSATRAQVAAILMRFGQKYVEK